MEIEVTDDPNAIRLEDLARIVQNFSANIKVHYRGQWQVCFQWPGHNVVVDDDDFYDALSKALLIAFGEEVVAHGN